MGRINSKKALVAWGTLNFGIIFSWEERPGLKGLESTKNAYTQNEWVNKKLSRPPKEKINKEESCSGLKIHEMRCHE